MHFGGTVYVLGVGPASGSAPPATSDLVYSRGISRGLVGILYLRSQRKGVTQIIDI